MQKKANKKTRANTETRAIDSRVSPEEAVEFIESMRLLSEQVDEATVAISIRIPGNILRLIKIKARSENKKYQSLIIEYLRQGLWGL
jgi:predicted DNA binding CopG/RHH family protein